MALLAQTLRPPEQLGPASRLNLMLHSLAHLPAGPLSRLWWLWCELLGEISRIQLIWQIIDWQGVASDDAPSHQ